MSSTPRESRLRVPLRPRWWAAFVLVPLLVGLAAAFVGRASVESNLQTRVERSVLSSGVSAVTVVVDGQDVKATLPTTASASSLDAVRNAVLRVDGVRAVKVQR